MVRFKKVLHEVVYHLYIACLKRFLHHHTKGGVFVENKLHNIITINGEKHLAEPGENLLDVLNTTDNFIPQICYNESLGPIQTCDTCIVEVNGEKVRACGTIVDADMDVSTTGDTVKGTQKESLDRILEKHELY